MSTRLATAMQKVVWRFWSMLSGDSPPPPVIHVFAAEIHPAKPGAYTISRMKETDVAQRGVAFKSHADIFWGGSSTGHPSERVRLQETHVR